MGEITGRCPNCGKTLKVPDDVEKFLCMYCGTGLTPADLAEEISEENQTKTGELQEEILRMYEAGDEKLDLKIAEALDIDEFDKVANLIFLKKHIPEIVLNYEDIMTQFTRILFPKSFNQYASECKHIIETADRVMSVWGSNGAAKIAEAAQCLVDAIEKRIDKDPSCSSKRARYNKKEDLKMVLAIYAVPMVQFFELPVGNVLADAIVEAWCKKNPKNPIGKGNYQDLEAGFKKGKLCFITTAVCEAFGKADDCYELTSFRNFRDTYMVGEREALVNEYYDIAPGIVTCIDLGLDREQVYQEIWEKWLFPCLTDIESGNEEACAKRYEDMVLTLKSRYLS